MPQHLTALKGSGLTLEAYVYLYFPLSPWNQTPESRVQACINMIRLADVPVGRIWLDVEVEGVPTDTAVNTIQALQRCESIIRGAGFEPGIYTSITMWTKMCANISAFNHLPLWDAHYLPAGSPQPPDMTGFRPYGGWTAATMWQYQGTTELCGHSVDLNVALDVSVGTPDPLVQADAVIAVLKQINDYQLGVPFPPLDAVRKAVFSRVNDLVQKQ